MVLLSGSRNLTASFKTNMELLGYTAVSISVFDEAEEILEKYKPLIIFIEIQHLLDSGVKEKLLPILAEYKLPLVVLYDPAETEKLNSINSVHPYGVISENSDINVWKASINAALLSSSEKSAGDAVKIEDELEHMRSMLADVLDTIPIRVFWKDLNSVYMGCNRHFAMDSGKNLPEDIVGLTDYDIREKERAAMNRLDDRKVVSSGKPRINYEEIFITTQGEKNWISTSKIPLYNREGEMYGILGMYENITVRRQMQEELKIQKTRLSNIIYGSNAGTWEWNRITGENVVNEYWASMIGYSYDELPHDKTDFWMDFIHPEDMPRVNALLEDYDNGVTDIYECEFRVRHKDGRWVWVLSRGKATTFTEEGAPLLLTGVHLDINQRKLAQEQLLQQLEEKEIILKEAHHRIKNNFASICGLLNLQAESLENDEAKEALVDASGRVHSLQVLYEKLLLVDNYKATSVNEYLGDLIEDIIYVYEDKVRIKIEKKLCECRLDTKQLFPVGIITNELITNAMKYAFPGRDSGAISILLEDNDETFSLVIHDDGIGLPDDFDINKEHGFGLMLVKAFTQQLNGSLKIENDNGTRVTVEFNKQQ